jgi:hypothetical protein
MCVNKRIIRPVGELLPMSAVLADRRPGDEAMPHEDGALIIGKHDTPKSYAPMSDFGGVVFGASGHRAMHFDRIEQNSPA